MNATGPRRTIRCMQTLTVLLALSITGCAAAFGQTDAFPRKLEAGCGSLRECEGLETEAQARVKRCQPNTIGYIRCSDAQADLLVARTWANKWRQFEADKLTAAKAAEAKKEQAERERKEDERLAAAEKKRKAEIEKRDSIRAAKDQERRDRISKDQAEAAARSKELDRLSLLSPAMRAQEYRDCVKRTQDPCTDLLNDLINVADNKAEKKALFLLGRQTADDLARRKK